MLAGVCAGVASGCDALCDDVAPKLNGVDDCAGLLRPAKGFAAGVLPNAGFGVSVVAGCADGVADPKLKVGVFDPSDFAGSAVAPKLNEGAAVD